MYNDIQACDMNNGHASIFLIYHKELGRDAQSLQTSLLSLKYLRMQYEETQVSWWSCFYNLVVIVDMCLFLPDKVSFKNALNVFEDFTKCSGLRVNMEKSDAIWNGPSSNYRHKIKMDKNGKLLWGSHFKLQTRFLVKKMEWKNTCRFYYWWANVEPFIY